MQKLNTPEQIFELVAVGSQGYAGILSLRIPCCEVAYVSSLTAAVKT
jgi:hypothetical protein